MLTKSVLKKNRISLICVKNQEKLKPLINEVDVGNACKCWVLELGRNWSFEILSIMGYEIRWQKCGHRKS